MINFGCNIVSISSSQLMNLTTTPVNLLNGMTNEIIVPHRVVLSYIAGSIPYKGDGDNMVISLGTITFGKIDSNFLKGNINLLSLINIQDWKNLTTASFVNQSLLLQNTGKDFSAGDGYLKVFTFYSTIDIGL